MTQLKKHSIEKLPMKTAFKNPPSAQHRSLYIHPNSDLLSLIIFNVYLLCLYACERVRAMAHVGGGVRGQLGSVSFHSVGSRDRTQVLTWQQVPVPSEGISQAWDLLSFKEQSSLQQTNKQTNTLGSTLAAI